MNPVKKKLIGYDVAKTAAKTKPAPAAAKSKPRVAGNTAPKAQKTPKAPNDTDVQTMLKPTEELEAGDNPE